MTELRIQPRRQVLEVMSSPPLMVPGDATVAEAAEVLYGEGVGAVLVGSPDELLGVLSERDVVSVVAHGRDPSTTLVRNVMTAPAIHIQSDDTLLDAAVLALDLSVRHLPVTTDGVVSGVVSIRDLVRPLLVEALTSRVD